MGLLSYVFILYGKAWSLEIWDNFIISKHLQFDKVGLVRGQNKNKSIYPSDINKFTVADFLLGYTFRAYSYSFVF